MRKYCPTISLLFFLLAVQWGSVEASYDYPIKNPIDATFTFTLLKGKYRGWKNYIQVRDQPEDKPIGYMGPNGYPTNSFFHRGGKEAPLVFLLVGIGGGVRVNGALYIANRLFRSGYHVVILPSTFTSNFIHSVSEHRYVGQIKSDAMDQYKALKKVKEFVLSKGVQVTSWKLFGYSFGAAVGAFVSDMDAKEKNNPLGIDRYVLLNPPVDLLDGLNTVDEFAATPIKKKIWKFFKLFELIFDFRMIYGAEDIPNRFRLGSKVGTDDLKYFIGKSLKSSLAKVIHFTQQKLDLGILGSKISFIRKIRARRYSLADYVHVFMRRFYETTEIGKRIWQNLYGTNKYDLEILRFDNSLYSLEENLRDNQKVHIIHNSDDFLLHPVDIEFLQETMGERFVLYPHGGHIGNVWYHENFQLYHELLADTGMSQK